MEVEFDRAKDAANQTKHGLSLVLGLEVFADPFCVTLPARSEIEPRYQTLGMVMGRVHVAIWTKRDDMIRLISVRKANARETRKYRQNSPSR